LVIASYIAPAIALDKGKYDAANRDRDELSRRVIEVVRQHCCQNNGATR
jgi:hypothetical protein